MLTTWSPLLVNGVNVSTCRLPRTTVPAGAPGVITTVTVPVWPGASRSGLNVAVGSTDSSQTSPVLDVTAGSNSEVSAAAATLTVAFGPPLGGNGPRSSGMANQKPGATSGWASTATAAFPNETARGSGCPKLGSMAMTIGTVAWAAMTSCVVSVGTRKAGGAASGSATLLAPKPSSGSTPIRLSRGSTKKNSLWTPVLVTWTVAVTGRPACSTVPAESGRPAAVTGRPVKPMCPVNGSWKCVPSM